MNRLPAANYVVDWQSETLGWEQDGPKKGTIMTNDFNARYGCPTCKDRDVQNAESDWATLDMNYVETGYSGVQQIGQRADGTIFEPFTTAVGAAYSLVLQTGYIIAFGVLAGGYFDIFENDKAAADVIPGLLYENLVTDMASLAVGVFAGTFFDSFAEFNEFYDGVSGTIDSVADFYNGLVSSTTDLIEWALK